MTGKTPRKTPRRVAVAKRSVPVSPASPGWISGTDVVFSSPKSPPSAARRTTRRTSVYQSKSAAPSSDDVHKLSLFKVPAVVSPAGVKTRARRSSIYQNLEQRAVVYSLSPPKKQKSPTSARGTHSRRSSIYQKTAVSVGVKSAGNKMLKKSANKPPKGIPSTRARIRHSPKITIFETKRVKPISLKESTSLSVVSTKEETKYQPQKLKSPLVKTHKTPAKRSRRSQSDSPTKFSPVKSPTDKLPAPVKGSTSAADVDERKFKTPAKKTKSRSNSPKKSSVKKMGKTPKVQTATPDSSPANMSILRSGRCRKASIYSTPMSTPATSSVSSKKSTLGESPELKASSKCLDKVKDSTKGTPVMSSKQVAMDVSVRLSPLEISNIINVPKSSRKRKAVENSPSPRPSKLAKLAAAKVPIAQSTPLAIKSKQKASQKNLISFDDTENMNNNASLEGNETVAAVPDDSILLDNKSVLSPTKDGDMTLNNTVDSDSRSSRCIIL